MGHVANQRVTGDNQIACHQTLGTPADIRPSVEISDVRAPVFVVLLASDVMERIMTRKLFGFAGIAAALFAAPAVAHHAFAMFDQSKVLTMSGTVKQFDFVNPHAWLHVAIVNDKGDTLTWLFEGGSPSQLVALGWSKDRPRIGDKIEVGFRPMKDGSRGGQLMNVKFPSGEKLCSNRGCGDGTGNIVPGVYQPPE